MNEATRQRLFGTAHAFDDPTTVGLVVGTVAVLAIGGLAIFVLSRTGRVSAERQVELEARWRTWLFIAAGMLIPLLLGAAYFMVAVLALSLLCYREYARGTGLFRERLVSATVVLGMFIQTFAVFDHWYDFFVALTPITVSLIVAVGVLSDRPSGYIQRVALGGLGYLLFGAGLAHLGYMANDPDYRKIVLWLFACVALNDVFAYIVGNKFGRHKLAPHTSPNKTVEGAVGAVFLTTAVAVALGHVVFRGSEMDHWGHLIVVGVLISVAGQLGDLVLSSIKRDLGIKDFGAALPGHGGWLDRFDSLVISVPAVFHYVGYVRGFGLDEQWRIFTYTP